jgi:hypothetical protein
MTALTQVKFNPYWNAPASIVERDIIPKMAGGTRVLEDMNIKVFKGVGGPEVDPGDVDWSEAVADDYHFRQEPGPENAMATAKVEFKSPFGIYLHDTPEKALFKSGRRFYSSGCVRVEKMPVLVNWVLNNQEGFNRDKIATMAETLERLDVDIATPPQLRVTYLTAWPVGNTVAFRNDVYDLDQSGFTVGQPMPVGEESDEGLRYVLKPIARTQAQVDAAEGMGFFENSLFGSGKPKAKQQLDIYGSPVSESDMNGFKPGRATNAGKNVRVGKQRTPSFFGTIFTKSNSSEKPVLLRKPVAAKPAKFKQAGPAIIVKSNTLTVAKAKPNKLPAKSAAAATTQNASAIAKKPVSRPLPSKAIASAAKPGTKAVTTTVTGKPVASSIKEVATTEQAGAKANAATAKKIPVADCTPSSVGKVPASCNPAAATKTSTKPAAL